MHKRLRFQLLKEHLTGVIWCITIPALLITLWFVLPVCKGAKADLVFLIDGSWSIGDESFDKVRQFVFSMIGAFDVIDSTGMQVADLSVVMCTSS